jgi:hypothetical protein
MADTMTLFRGGVWSGWSIRALGRSLSALPSPNRSCSRETQTLTGGDVLPGFPLRLRKLFTLLHEELEPNLRKTSPHDPGRDRQTFFDDRAFVERGGANFESADPIIDQVALVIDQLFEVASRPPIETDEQLKGWARLRPLDRLHDM